MKKFKISAIALMIAISFYSCDEAGTTMRRLNGNEANLPDELKGLKIYKVTTNNGGEVAVALLDNKVNSLTYQDGKVKKCTIIVNKRDGRS